MSKKAELVTQRLLAQKKSITFMESCTSGLLATWITDTEESSKVFRGSLVTYANETKVQFGVDPDVIKKYGVYSAECAREMAYSAQQTFGTDYAVGITGTTGNVDPNNVDSVRGEVFYCIRYQQRNFDFHFSIDVENLSRTEIKTCYAETVCDSLLKVIGG